MTALESGSHTKVLLRKSFGERMIISHKEQRAVLEASAGKRVVDSHYAAITHPLPSLNGPDGLLIRQTKAYTCQIVIGNRADDVPSSLRRA